mmetsp:Transcript_14534/g.22567  ORF Transcript_14534/g.22567 Transcript_14534/m.22567 type:complete len:209 (+) Transcript_14534:3059-3685(+)
MFSNVLGDNLEPISISERVDNFIPVLAEELLHMGFFGEVHVELVDLVRGQHLINQILLLLQQFVSALMIVQAGVLGVIVVFVHFDVYHVQLNSAHVDEGLDGFLLELSLLKLLLCDLLVAESFVVLEHLLAQGVEEAADTCFVAVLRVLSIESLHSVAHLVVVSKLLDHALRHLFHVGESLAESVGLKHLGREGFHLDGIQTTGHFLF